MKLYIAGHTGLVGSALTRRFSAAGSWDLVLRTLDELDLTNQAAARSFFAAERPDAVILAAAKVGGILANSTYPGDFIRENLLIQTNVIDAAYRSGVQKFVFLGSSCIYPKLAPQPLREEYLLTGLLEPTNEAYAVAKIAGITMCQSYRKQYGFQAISLMPTNLYGPGDNFDLQSSHVLPALIRKFHEANADNRRSVTIWGTGTPRREFLHVDDLADACAFLLGRDFDELHSAAPNGMFNVGVGEDIEIREVAELIRQTVGFQGDVVFDTTKPDGTPRKLMDVSRIRSLGWSPKIKLADGIASTYQWFLNTENTEKRTENTGSRADE